ncbi:hypothetical protein A8H32_26115 [Burkholderia thailandensis]|nr:hypothetical protein A8H32_26115 [Burkholderia thailandensis]
MAPIVRSIIQERDYFKQPAFGRRGNNRYRAIRVHRFDRSRTARERGEPEQAGSCRRLRSRCSRRWRTMAGRGVRRVRSGGRPRRGIGHLPDSAAAVRGKNRRRTLHAQTRRSLGGRRA